MKSIRGNSFFMETRAVKRRKMEDEFFGLLPREMWLEIIKYLDKKSFQELTAVCAGLHEFAKDYRVCLGLPWPAIDYSDRLPSVKSLFRWDSMGEQHYNKPKIFPLKNGDIAVGMSDGRLIVLKFNESKWQVFGRHQIKQINGKWRGFPIHDVVLLESGEIVSCGVDGIRVWNRVLAKQKYQIKLPKNAGWMSRPHRLLELPNQKLACGCWDGSVAILSKQYNSLEWRYQYDGLLEIGDDKEIHCLNNITLFEDELIGEYSQFINRWNVKSKKLIARVELSELRNILFQAVVDSSGSEVSARMLLKLGESNIHDKDVMKLAFDWRFPNGFVWVDVNSNISFLVNMRDVNAKPYFFGSNARLGITNENDIVYISSSGCIDYNWNAASNQFNGERALPERFRLHQSLFLSSGNILFFNFLDSSKVSILNPYDSTETTFDLEIPPSCGIANKTCLLSETYLIGYGCNYDLMDPWDYFIWDLSTGKLLCSLPSIKEELIPLPSGDLLSIDSSLKLDHQHNGLFEKDEEIEVFRFKLRK